MKLKSIARLGALALAMSLVTTSMLSGTLAKYTTTIDASASATVALWSVGTDVEDAIVSLFDTTYDNVVEDRVAPGTSGGFDIELENASEVDVLYTVTMTVADTGKC